MQSETLTYPTPGLVESEPANLSDDLLAIQRIKNEVAMRLLQTWLADESGYDEKVWELVKKVIEENMLSNRKRFDD
ncbi:MAG: hypothetical protein ONB45_12280 [candidate division KSB1 bacterium]|nr:hypothetical protein [candidate division KSB1 bacterium]